MFNQISIDLSCIAGYLQEHTPQRKATGHKEVATMEGTHTTERFANEASNPLHLIIKK